MEPQEEKKQPRITNTSAFLMVGTAIVFDLISIVPVIGQAVAVVGSAIVFLIWFLILRLPLISPKKLLTIALSYLGESVPAISVLPLITLGVILMIVFTRAEDKLGIRVLDKVGAGKVSAGAVRAERKAVRRALDPERTARTQERLARMKVSREARGISDVAKSRPEMKDFNYKKAA